ncbi:hypothetical protein VMCG_09166 [Cytospora schulzeri]|uniref:PNPLA domain-containing protein n=1 Tax=Cytospora schulzeri TaxID=448051 RepID=A0A423VLT4_9PEZI|nr:hypothetical protein VMCG_09166 [Valsa malicola]
MLGLFEMDVQSCIDKYQELAKIVFTPRKRARVFGRILPAVLGTAPFDHKLLEREIKRLSFEFLGDEDAPLYQKTSRCKVFVCTSLSNSETVRLRSYDSKFEDHIRCTVWEAGRATSAAPSFFDPITFSNGIVFRDGALQANNPVYELMQEAMNEFPSQEIDTIVSIGTGVPASINMSNGLHSVAKACGKIATDTERIAKKFEADYCMSGRQFEGKYFRFNVTKGVEGVRLEEWQKTDIMMSSTLSYLGQYSTSRELRACAYRLDCEITEVVSSRSRISTGPASDEDLPPSGQSVGFPVCEPSQDELPRTVGYRNSFYQLDRIGKGPVPYFVTRAELDQIREHFANIDNTSQSRIVCLLGLGGSGKTQLTLQYAWSRREEFGVVLWVNASSEATLRDSFELAASQLGLRLPRHEAGVSKNRAIATYERPDVFQDVNAVKQELRRRNQPWLIVFDKVDNEDVLFGLNQYIPSDLNGHILLSSRRQEARRLGQKYINIHGLPRDGAIGLLMYHAGIEHPSTEQLKIAQEIVQQLDCIALAVDLAGRSYIQNPGGLRNYLHLYKSNKEKLYQRSLGHMPSHLSRLTGYEHSVYAAWQISIAAIPTNTAKFLHLLCFLDPTNLSKEFLKRACHTKLHWDRNGELAILKPRECGVPEWLLELLCESDGEWSDFKYHETVNQLASLFFVRQDILEGTWLHETGPVETSSLLADGNEMVLLQIPQPLHDLGRYMLGADERTEFCYGAFSVCVHAFPNDVSEIDNLRDPSRVPLYVGEGGESQHVQALRRDLEQLRRHIEIFRHDIQPFFRG